MIMSYLIALYFIAMMTALDGYSYCDDYLVYSSDEDVKLKYTSKFIWYLDNRFCKIEITIYDYVYFCMAKHVKLKKHFKNNWTVD